MLRRILMLTAISIAGVALLAPVAARSATPVPVDIADGLLSVSDAPVLLAERGGLSGRQGTLAIGLSTPAPQPAAEELQGDPLPTPVAVPMEATLQTIATPAPEPVATAAPQRVVTYDGSTVWDDLAKCESGGNWAINTGNGYYGGLQFNLGTWQDYGGAAYAAYPHEATRDEQIAVAERLHAARGFAPWPACRVKLGLP
ncbi:MAG: transglycosylase family protein [Candidatus Limnocylindria bacterium]